MLEGVNVALGVSGSIAAVKTVELAHELQRHGAAVRAVMTESAQGIIHPWSLEFATEHDVVTQLTGAVEHVELCGYEGWADVLLLAPTTANTLGKIASSVDDTPVTTCATTALGAGIPVIAAPAMHEPMYEHPGVNDSIETLSEWGVSFVEPRMEEGKAKIASEEAIVLDVARESGTKPLAGKTVIVTSGATSESIDPIRVLTNRASGRTGRAVARACYIRGASVILVHDGPDVPYATVDKVESAGDMITSVREHATTADALVSAAAIGDYSVEPAAEKIRSGQELTLEFKPTPKLIDTIRDENPDLPIIGFKAETSGEDETMIAEARRILERAELSFVVANDASVMGADESRVIVTRADDTTEYAGPKPAIGNAIADELRAELTS